MTNNKKEFFKKLQGLSRSRSPHRVFSDWLEIAALSMHQLPYHGNTLSDEYWEHRPTPQLQMFEQWLAPQRRAARLAQAMQSILAGTASAEPEVRDSPPVGKKSSGQTLFDLESFAGGSLTRKRSTQKPDVVLDRQMDLFG